MPKEKLRKFLRNSGQEYVTKKGKVVKAKIFEDKDCGCSKKCMTQITTEERQKCFDNFWKMGDFGKQNAYLSGLVTKAFNRYRFHLNCTNIAPTGVIYQKHINVGKVSKQVCQKYFLQTFLVSYGRLHGVLRKVENEKEPGEDLRGKRPPARKTSEEQLNRVRDHINQFPRYECHNLHNSKGKYLKFLNVSKMHRLYVERCTSNNIPFVTEKIYRNVFNKEFNLTFLSPRRDPCNQARVDCARSQNNSRKKNTESVNNNHAGFEVIRPPMPQSQLSPHLSQSLMRQKYPVLFQLIYPSEDLKYGYNYHNAGHNLHQDQITAYNHCCPAILPH